MGASHLVRLTDETWAGLHVARAILLAKLGRNVSLDRVLRFLLEVLREARSRDPRILDAAFERVFPATVATPAR